VVHPRTYEMDEFLYEAYSLAVLGNARLEKMGKEVVSHTRRLRKHARRTGEEETVVANLVSSMLLPTTTAFETKLRDVLDDATNAIVYVGAMRAFASTEVQQALSSTDQAYLDKVGDYLEELYRAELDVLKTSKKLRRALRRLGGSAGEFRDELSTDTEGDDDDIFGDEDENSPKAVAKRAREAEGMFRDYEEERRVMNSIMHDQTSIAESDVFSDAGSTKLDPEASAAMDDEYFSMMGERQSTIARKLQHAYTRDPSMPHYYFQDETQPQQDHHVTATVDAIPVSGGSDHQPSESGYAFGAGDPYASLHAPDDREDETDYMAILEAGRARERTSSVRRYSSFKGR
jgi:Sec-independent protein translocase protein TatA